MKKTTAGITAGIIALSMLSGNVSAMSYYSILWDDSGLHVRGNTDGADSNVSMSVTDADGKLVYADQKKSGADRGFAFSAPMEYGENMIIRLTDAAASETVVEQSSNTLCGLEIYPEYPDTIPRNNDFSVMVTQNSVQSYLPVYDTGGLLTFTDGGSEHIYDRHRRFCEFAFEGSGVTLSVTPAEAYEKYDIIANGEEIPSYETEDGSIVISLNEPRDFVLRLDGDKLSANDYGRVLSFFVDKRDSYIPSGDGVIYKAAGLHEENITLTGGQTLYLAPGAVVKGKVKASGTDVKICGHGILFDPNEGDGDGQYMITQGPSYNAEIRDIKIAGRSRGTYNIVLRGAVDTLIENVRIISCLISDDGISMFSGTDKLKVNKCFIYNVDNVFVLGGSTLNSPSTASITGCLIGTTCSVFYPQSHVGIVKAENNTAFEMASGSDKKHGLIQNRIDPYGEASIACLKIKNFDASKSNITAKLMWIQGCGEKYAKNIKLINVHMREPDATLWGAPHQDIYVNTDAEFNSSGNYNVEIDGLYFDEVKVTEIGVYSPEFAAKKNSLTVSWNYAKSKIAFLPQIAETGVLQTPYGLSGALSGKHLILTWTECDIDVDYYNIYRNGNLIGRSEINSYRDSIFEHGDIYTVQAVYGDMTSELSGEYVNEIDGGKPISNRMVLYKNTYGSNAEECVDDNVKAFLRRKFIGSPKGGDVANNIGFDLWHNDSAVERKSIDPDAEDGDLVVRFCLRAKNMIDAGTTFAGEGFSFNNRTSGGLTVVDLSECEQQGYISMDIYIGKLYAGITSRDIYITLGDLRDCHNGDYIASDTNGGNSGNALLSENLVGVRLSDYYSDSDVGNIKTIHIPLSEFAVLDDNTWQYSYEGIKRGINLEKLSYLGYVWAPSDTAAEFDSTTQYIYMDNVSIQNVIAPEITAESTEGNKQICYGQSEMPTLLDMIFIKTVYFTQILIGQNLPIRRNPLKRTAIRFHR